MNDEAVYRTAPATPGLLNTVKTLTSLKEEEQILKKEVENRKKKIIKI